jgi:hypothetical protein
LNAEEDREKRRGKRRDGVWGCGFGCYPQASLNQDLLCFPRFFVALFSSAFNSLGRHGEIPRSATYRAATARVISESVRWRGELVAVLPFAVLCSHCPRFERGRLKGSMFHVEEADRVGVLGRA